MKSLKQFSVFLDIYYWRTALLIAKNLLFKQYRNSFLGVLWTLLQPLAMITVYAIIMPMIMRFSVRDYLLYILCTMPLWGFISNSLVGSATSLISQSEVLKRSMVSCTTFPIADVMRQCFVYLISFSTMYSFALLFGLSGSWHVLLVPIYLIPVIITLMAAAVGVAFFAPYVRDIGEVLLVGMNVMFWLSAVPYPIEVAPPEVHPIFQWNPFYIMMEPIITLVYGHALPSEAMMVRLFSVMAISVAAGYGLYRRFRQHFVYYL